MATPSLADKAAFFANVLADADFIKSGILFGDEPTLARDLKWVVVDANRLTMKVWEKSYATQDVVAAAQGLGAAVFSNGPYFAYTAGSSPSLPKYLASGYVDENRLVAGDLKKVLPKNVAGKALAEAGAVTATGYNLVRDGFTWVGNKVLGPGPSQERMGTWNSDKAWAGAGPLGHVIRNGVASSSRSATNLAYFGRKTATDFSSFEVGEGDPKGFAEAIGALQLAIKDGKATQVELATGSNQWFFWGLAPLSPTDALFAATNLKTALTAYGGAPGVGKAPEGLIIGLYYVAPTQVQRLLDIGVRDAARLDGSDSVLFGKEKTILVGDSMSASKRTIQGWGFAFYANA